MIRVLLTVLLAAVFIGGAALGYFNREPVRFHYLFGSADVRLAVLLAGALVGAVALTLAFCVLRMLRLHRELRRLRRQLLDSETELKNLRNLPLASPR